MFAMSNANKGGAGGIKELFPVNPKLQLDQGQKGFNVSAIGLKDSEISFVSSDIVDDSKVK